MSKKFKKNRRQFPWPVLAFGVLLLAAAAFLFLSGRGGATGTPVLVVDNELIDFGVVKLDESRAFTITVTNNGAGALQFKEKPYIEIREGC